jgi:hypothetical protein
MKAGSAFESPDSTRAFAGGRKQSIKRKPLNLTREDEALVSNSPPTSAHRRNFSTGTIQSNRSGDIPENQPGNKGLGSCILLPIQQGLLRGVEMSVDDDQSEKAEAETKPATDSAEEESEEEAAYRPGLGARAGLGA